MRGTAAALAAVTASAAAVAASCRSSAPIGAPTPPALVQPVAEAWVKAPIVRVGIQSGVRATSIGADSGVVVSEAAAAGRSALVQRATFRPATGNDGPRVKLLETGEEFQLALVTPQSPDEMLSPGAEPYRGVFEVRAEADKGLTLVNVVNLEDYLRGVVPNELSPTVFPEIEASKAQAVAARTYALRNLGQFKAKGYDLCATAACQVYRGRSTEHSESDQAVLETAGLVATHGGEPINALYTSTCGGHTEDGSNVFDGEPQPYLRGVLCAPEKESYRWEVRLTPEEVAKSIARYGSVGEVEDVLVTRLGVSGRVAEVLVRGRQGALALRGLKIRWGLGLRENLFVIDRERREHGDGVARFVFTGKGWGHGVGLCQVGAYGMAQAGASFERILKHYYAGITLERQRQ